MRNSHGSAWTMAKITEKRAKWETNTSYNTARNTEKNKIWEIHTVVLHYGERTEKCGKWDTNTVWPGIRQEKLKSM